MKTLALLSASVVLVVAYVVLHLAAFVPGLRSISNRALVHILGDDEANDSHYV